MGRSLKNDTPATSSSRSRGPVTTCVVTTSYPSDEGDPSGHFVQAEVAELEKAGHTVAVIKPAPGGAFGWPGVASRLRQNPWHAFDAASWMLRAPSQLRAIMPSRIIAHWSVPSAWPVVTNAGLNDIPLEIVSHGGDVRLLVGMPRRMRARVLERLLTRATSWRFVSSELLAQLVSVLDDEQSATLRGVAVVAPSPLAMLNVEEDVRARRGTLGNRPLYVCAGRLVPSKRVDRVIDYVAGHRAGMPILVVIGDGPERRRLEELAHRWQLDVRFLGNMQRRETLAWIGAADELVHASVAEGMSTVVREAEHLGVKVTRL